jgi:hypothetical protein
MASVHLSRDKGIYRVRVLPPDAAPSVPIAAETHVGYLSAQTAAATVGKLLGFPIIDETLPKGGGHGQA